MGVFEHAPRVLTDGDRVSIEPPLQGGYVLYLGVRARNVHGLTTRIDAAVVDVGSPRVIAIEQRPVRLLDDGTGWAAPESQYQDLGNVPVCSTVTGATDFDQTTWRLQVHLTDGDGRTADTAVLINPTCDPLDSFGCECACDSERPGDGSCAVDPVDGGVALDAAQ